ncbi:MAG: LptF/LptG family permease [Saprospiraceae bacterium]
MKRVDLMLIKGFLPPFVVSFSIALFVLVMQTLWLYIDDIIGKGAGFLVILEFLSYLSISLIPLALPIGVLLAGVFLFGNLGENYELSSIKSAGISLMRIMRPIIVIGAMVGVLSWFFSDYIIPQSNLKFLSRLHDLKRQKPTLSIAEGVFNEDFYGYVIRIEKKSSDGMHIQKIQISDHSNPNSQTMILAKKGIMYATVSGEFLVMQLEDGEMIQTPDKRSISNAKFPFLRSKFDTLTKVFSLKEFDLEKTDEELFKGNQKMKNSSQLRVDIDSLDQEKQRLRVPMLDRFGLNNKVFIASKKNSILKLNPSENSDHLENSRFRFENNIQQRDSEIVVKLQNKLFHPDTLQSLANSRQAYALYERDINAKVSYEESLRSISVRESKFIYELLIKYSYALICLIFIFVGAPLGAIVRKGGYGYPLLLCILVFVSYILLNTFFKRLSESLAVSAQFGAWIPCAIIVIPGILLSWTAMRDRNLFHDLKLYFRRKIS